MNTNGKIRSRTLLVTFVVLSYLLTIVFGWTLVLYTAPVLANETLCIPPAIELNNDGTVEGVDDEDTQGDGRGERFRVDDWLEVRVINRATIQITMKPGNKKCSNLDLSLNAINADEGSGSFKSLIDGILTDEKVDDTYTYINRKGNDSGDDTRIDEFKTYPSERKIDGKYIGVFSTEELNQHFSNIELAISIEEDAIPSVRCSGTNSNIALSVKDNQLVWSCTYDIDGKQGLEFSPSDILDIENFNIVYTISDDATAINIVSSGSPDNDSFKWCDAIEPEPVFRNGSCNNASLEIRNVTPEQLLQRGNDTKIELEVNKVGDPTVIGTTLAAGFNTEQGQTSQDLVGASSQSKTCESEGGAFSFILCPLLNYSNDGIEWLDNRIINMLDINKEYYEDGGSVQQAWASMRNIAYILLIPILLIMVIGTALGFSFIDAYTVKRALPRLFIAIIFMALSFDLLSLMIDVVSIVGNGIGGIIAAPFGGRESLTLQQIFQAPSDLAGNALWGGILGFGGIAIIGSVSLPVIGSFLLVAFLALAIVFALLVLREMVILFLMIVSPFAILSWIFPGNDKIWKFWWQSFSKLLYLFPLIVALLVTGRAFASLVDSTPTEENAVVITLIKLTAFIGPFFFIPKAFQAAGGVFANLAGMANDKSRGIFDGQRKKRGALMAQNRKDTLSGNREGFGRFGNKAVNSVGRRVGAGSKGRFGFGERGKSVMESRRRQAAQDEIKNNAQLNDTALNDDDAAAILMGGDTHQNAVKTTQDLQNHWKNQYMDRGLPPDAAEEKAKSRADAAFKRARALGFTSRNSTAMEQLYMQNKARSIGAGDPDNVIGRALDRKYGENSLARTQAQGGVEYHARAGQRFDIGGTEKASLYQLAGSDTKSIQAWGANVIASGDQRRKAIHLAELRSMQPNTTELNRDEVNGQIQMLEADTALQAAMSAPTGDPSGETMGDVAKREARAYEPVDPRRSS